MALWAQHDSIPKFCTVRRDREEMAATTAISVLKVPCGNHAITLQRQNVVLSVGLDCVY